MSRCTDAASNQTRVERSPSCAVPAHQHTSIPSSGSWRWRQFLVIAGLGAVALLAACERTDTVQRGHRGTGMLQVYAPAAVAAAIPLNQVPDPEPVDDPDPEAPSIAEAFKNVTVLNDLTVLEFSRLMQAMSTWVAPDEGCEFCHNPNNLASDEKYTKVVARRMLQMTRQINTDWKTHVAGTGVTCWTCHRGQAVPSGDWFANPGPASAMNVIGNRTGQNRAGIDTVVNASLPSDPLSAFLDGDNNIRIQGTDALAGTNRHSIKQAEWSYSLMLYMSKSLGVNCTYCHNTRALARWDESSPQRATAWYGIRMVRELNSGYLNPIAPLLPAHRLSAEGDGPKVGCETCHKGAYKPLYGALQLGDYPELAGVLVRPPAPAASAAPADPTVAAAPPPVRPPPLGKLQAIKVAGPADAAATALGLPPR
jgi:photosynthetic reaction center cytochrome c subunit